MNCPLCSPVDESLLWQDTFCRVIWVDDAAYPGFCRVILNAHVREMTDLPPAERPRLMQVVFAVEAAVREVVKPDKINLASLGNDDAADCSERIQPPRDDRPAFFAD